MREAAKPKRRGMMKPKKCEVTIMTTEKEVFDNYLILQDRLLSYGFQRDGNKLVYRKPLPEPVFQVQTGPEDSRKDTIRRST